MHPVVIATKYKAIKEISFFFFLIPNLPQLPGDKFNLCTLTLQLSAKIPG